MSKMNVIRAYFFSFLLMSSILIGGLFGWMFGHQAHVLKPIGDIFINFILVFIVPLIFFSLTSAIAALGKSKQLGSIVTKMLIIFLFTGTIAACFMIVVVRWFPPGLNISIPTDRVHQLAAIDISKQLTNMVSVSDFNLLLSHQAILPLIIISFLVGLATSSIGEKGKLFAKFLHAGSAISMKAIEYVMYFAPIGFFAYFAALIGDLGPQILNHYLRAAIVYSVSAIIYFFVCFSLYALIADPKRGVFTFWRHILLPVVTSLGTCSSAASIPANLKAVKNMGVPAIISKTTIPMGAVLHKDGSVLGAIVKIAFLFGILHLEFSGISTILSAIGISILVGTVMGAIPSGGMLGEMLILSAYGVNAKALMLLAPITLIIDPLATMLNVTGDCVCCLMLSRWTRGQQFVTEDASYPLSNLETEVDTIT